ncbi:MAG: ATP synthase F1 subunit delta [Chitinophagales bacterium]|nr:ATP synthase F1 subunit delta [Chitinophagales bacterium]
MSEFRLSSRYAKSLFDLALEKGELESVNNDMRSLQHTIKESREFQALLKSPVVLPDKKIAILEKIFSSRFNVITMTFLKLVANKRREEYLKSVTDEFVNFYNLNEKITPVTVTTAVEVDEEVLNNIKMLFTKSTGVTNIELTNIIDASILGGFTMQYGDKMLDASISRQLEAMDDQFLHNLFLKRYN